MKKINLLYLIPNLNVGGAEELLLGIARRFNRSHYKVAVACLWDKGPIAERMESMGVEVYLLGMFTRMDFTVIFRLAKLMQSLQTDVLHSHLFPANTIGRLAARIVKVPVVISTEHNIDVWKTFFHKLIDKILAKFTDRIITVSDAVRDFYIKEEGISADKYLTIHNGVDLERFNFIPDVVKKRKELGFKNEPVVGMFGRLVPQKTPQYFIEAASRIAGEIPEARFLVVGDGPLRKMLEERCNKLDIKDKVIFTGLRKDVLEIMAAIDVVSLSSSREGLSIVVLEAMALSKPVVATRVGGNPETIIDGRTGFLVEPNSPQQLADKIIILLRDRNRAEEMGRKGRERVEEEFNIDRTVKSTANLYETLLVKKSKKYCQK